MHIAVLISTLSDDYNIKAAIQSKCVIHITPSRVFSTRLGSATN